MSKPAEFAVLYAKEVAKVFFTVGLFLVALALSCEMHKAVVKKWATEAIIEHEAKGK